MYLNVSAAHLEYTNFLNNYQQATDVILNLTVPQTYIQLNPQYFQPPQLPPSNNNQQYLQQGTYQPRAFSTGEQPTQEINNNPSVASPERLIKHRY
jgi:hypothetical protein